MSDVAVAEAGVDSQESAPAPRKTKTKDKPTACTATMEAMFDSAHVHTCSLDSDHYEKDQYADHFCKECLRHWYKKEGTE